MIQWFGMLSFLIQIFCVRGPLYPYLNYRLEMTWWHQDLLYNFHSYFQPWPFCSSSGAQLEEAEQISMDSLQVCLASCMGFPMI